MKDREFNILRAFTYYSFITMKIHFLAATFIAGCTIMGSYAITWPTLAPLWEKDGGMFSYFFETKELSVSGNARVDGNLIVWSTGWSSKICLNGDCDFMSGVTSNGTKTCWMSESDAINKWCPLWSYISSVKKICNDDGTCISPQWTQCRFFKDTSSSAQAITIDGGACVWTSSSSTSIISFNTTGPYTVWKSGAVSVQIFSGWVLTPSKPATDYEMMTSGSIIETGNDGAINVIFTDDSIVRVDKNSRVIFSYSENNSNTLIQSGTIWARILRPFHASSAFTIESSDLALWVRWTAVMATKQVSWNTEITIIDSWEENSGSTLRLKDSMGNLTTTHVLYPNQTTSVNTATTTPSVTNANISSLLSINAFAHNNIQNDIIYMNQLLEKKWTTIEYQLRNWIKIKNEIIASLPNTSETGTYFQDNDIRWLYNNLSKHFPNKDLTIDLTKREAWIRLFPALKSNFINNNIAYVDAFVNAKAWLIIGYCLPNNNIIDGACTRSITKTGTYVWEKINATWIWCSQVTRVYTCWALNQWY